MDGPDTWYYPKDAPFRRELARVTGGSVVAVRRPDPPPPKPGKVRKMKPNRLAGHTLPNEGRLRTYNYLSSGPGKARCSCGVESPVLPSTAKRKAWHRDHKNDVRAGGSGIVWQGEN